MEGHNRQPSFNAYYDFIIKKNKFEIQQKIATNTQHTIPTESKCFYNIYKTHTLTMPSHVGLYNRLNGVA